MAAVRAARRREKEEEAAIDLSGIDLEAPVESGDFLVEIEEG
jgi:hypothetical protein